MISGIFKKMAFIYKFIFIPIALAVIGRVVYIQFINLKVLELLRIMLKLLCLYSINGTTKPR